MRSVGAVTATYASTYLPSLLLVINKAGRSKSGTPLTTHILPLHTHTHFTRCTSILSGKMASAMLLAVFVAVTFAGASGSVTISMPEVIVQLID